MRNRSLLLMLPALLLFAGCAGLMQRQMAGEALLLQNGDEIPCEIIEIGDDYIIFRAESKQDEFDYGDELPRSQVARIRIVQNGRTRIVSVDRYLEIYDAEFSEPVVADEPEPEPRPDAQRAQSEVFAEEFGRARADAPQPQNGDSVAPRENLGPGLRLERIASDSAAARRPASLGLDLETFVRPPASDASAPVDYIALADLIIASGATGLVLHRANQLLAENGSLPATQDQLVVALRSSERWQNRQDGLLRATEIAERAFNPGWPQFASEIDARLGFRPGRQTDVTRFLLHLRKHGGVPDRALRRDLETWFGREATAAMVDILANFDDWYYLLVIQGRN